MGRTNTAERIGAILPRFVGSLAGRKKYQIHLISFHWDRIVGEVIAAHVRPIRLDFHTLLLTADTPVWANELRYMERTLIDKINGYVAEELVRSIRFGPPLGQGLPRRREGAAKKAERWLGPSARERQQAEKACCPLAGSEIYEAAAGAMAQSLARQRQAAAVGAGPCPHCGAPNSSGGRLCLACEREEKGQKRQQIRRLLWEKPWLRYHEIEKILACPPDMVMAERWQLVQQLSGRVKVGDESSPEAKQLVMLFASLAPEHLTPEKMHQVLRRLRFDLQQDWEREAPAERSGRALASGKRRLRPAAGGAGRQRRN